MNLNPVTLNSAWLSILLYHLKNYLTEVMECDKCALITAQNAILDLPR